MKKSFSFFSLLSILFLILACDWQVPSKIQIKGSPSVTFAIGIDFSEMFREMMRDAFYDSEHDRDNLVIQDCINAPEWMTFLIRVGLVDYDQEIEGSINDAVEVGGNFTLPEDVHLIQTETTLLFSEFGNFLKDFIFNTDEIESSLFINISDDPMFGDIKIKLDFVDSTPSPKNVIDGKISEISKKSSDFFNINDREYTGVGVPAGSAAVDIKDFLNEKEDIVIKLDVFLEKNTSYPIALLNKLKEQNKLDIDVELFIWLPLVFESESEAELNLPGFEGLGGFLRSLSESGMIEYLKLEIGLNKNPFKDGEFVIRDADEYEITAFPMDETAMGFELKEDAIKYINDREDKFEPEFIISFDEKTKLGIPKKLEIMTVSVDAKINHTIKIGGGE
jgi:hypothetical protein